MRRTTPIFLIVMAGLVFGFASPSRAKIFRAEISGSSLALKKGAINLALGQGRTARIDIWSTDTESIRQVNILGPSSSARVPRPTRVSKVRHGNSVKRYGKYRLTITLDDDATPATLPIQVFHTNNGIDTVNVKVHVVPRVDRVDGLPLALNQTGRVTLHGKWFDRSQRYGPSSKFATFVDRGGSDTQWEWDITPKEVPGFHMLLIDERLPSPTNQVPDKKVRIDVVGAARPQLGKPVVTRPSVAEVNPQTFGTGSSVAIPGTTGCMSEVRWNYTTGAAPDRFEIRLSNVASSPNAPRAGFVEIVNAVPNQTNYSHTDFSHDVHEAKYSVRVSACKNTTDYGEICRTSDPKFLKVFRGGGLPSCGPVR